MKKILLGIFFLGLLKSSFAQQADSTILKRMQNAGDELIQFRSTFYQGFAIAGAGLLIGTAVFAIENQTEKMIVATISGGIVLTGMIITVVSFGHAGNAGEILHDGKISLNMREDGLTLAMKF